MNLRSIFYRLTAFSCRNLAACARAASGAAIVAVLLLAAATASAYGPYSTPATTYIKSGDQIILNRDISVSGGSRIYIQGGVAKPRSQVRELDPYCYFNLYRSTEVIKTAVSVEKDRFQITDTENYYEFVMDNRPPLQVATSLGFITQDASQRTLITRLKIRSTSQPVVTGLHCGIWAVANERNHVSLKEIKQALGDLVTLELHAE